MYGCHFVLFTSIATFPRRPPAHPSRATATGAYRAVPAAKRSHARNRPAVPAEAPRACAPARRPDHPRERGRALARPADATHVRRPLRAPVRPLLIPAHVSAGARARAPGKPPRALSAKHPLARRAACTPAVPTLKHPVRDRRPRRPQHANLPSTVAPRQYVPTSATFSRLSSAVWLSVSRPRPNPQQAAPIFVGRHGYPSRRPPSSHAWQGRKERTTADGSGVLLCSVRCHASTGGWRGDRTKVGCSADPPPSRATLLPMAIALWLGGCEWTAKRWVATAPRALWFRPTRRGGDKGSRCPLARCRLLSPSPARGVVDSLLLRMFHWREGGYKGASGRPCRFPVARTPAVDVFYAWELNIPHRRTSAPFRWGDAGGS